MNLAARAARLSMWVWDVGRDTMWPLTELRQYVGLSKDAAGPLRTRAGHGASGRPRSASTAPCAVPWHADEEVDVEYRVLEPDGSVRWMAARGRAEAGSDHRMTGVALDVTARKEAELQAEKDRAALTHMTRVSMMGQMSASIAHQLNQPLAAILGNAEAARKILRRDQPDLAEVREICEDIISEDRRAAEIIRRLGALFKRGEMHVAPLNLNELVTETLDLVRTELARRHVNTATELAPWLPLVEGGRVQLQQVLLNLILNAADAMNEVDPCQRKLIDPHRMRRHQRAGPRDRPRHGHRRPGHPPRVRPVLEHQGRRHRHRPGDLQVDHHGAPRHADRQQQPGRRRHVRCHMAVAAVRLNASPWSHHARTGNRVPRRR